MVNQALLEEAKSFLQRSVRERLRRSRRGGRSYVDDLMQVLYPEPEKKPTHKPSHGSDPSTAAASDGSVKLTQVVRRLRAERESQGLSLGDIYDATSITCGRLSRLENGIETNPTIGTLERIAAALGLRLRVTFVDAAESAEAGSHSSL